MSFFHKLSLSLRIKIPERTENINSRPLTGKTLETSPICKDFVNKKIAEPKNKPVKKIGDLCNFISLLILLKSSFKIKRIHKELMNIVADA